MSGNPFRPSFGVSPRVLAGREDVARTRGWLVARPSDRELVVAARHGYVDFTLPCLREHLRGQAG